MIEIELRYVAHITTLTGLTKERCRTSARTLRALIDELETQYAGFRQVFVDRQAGGLNLNAMIYYCDAGQTPLAVIDLDRPIQDGAVVTFW
ncbi:MAG: MoaD/ThiS family protein [Anaerolineales bacterium]|nr:MoaD/ThiS family protein [Anaerolineales bacterium]